MKLSSYKELFRSALSQYFLEEAESLFFITIEELFSLNRTDYWLQREEKIASEQAEQLLWILEQLKKEVPIQYIFNKAYFYGLSLWVDENVLIPRQETNELVDWVLQLSSKEEALRIIDICTGSGAIAIALKKHLPKAEVYALDVSEKALAVARKNALANGATIHFIEADVLAINRLESTFDIIVSNPPYVRELEKKEIPLNVLNYEPHLALFVPDDNPLLFYKAIATLSLRHLKEKGKLFFEINQYLSQQTVQMLEEEGFHSVILRKDLAMNDRMILATIEINNTL